LFQIVRLRDVVRVPPDRFGKPLKDVATEILKMRYESTLSPDYGYVIRVFDVKVDPVGKIIHGDAGIYHKAEFSILAFYPKIGEILEGEVVEITDFGAFVKIGPADALLHISQIMDDYLSTDMKQGAIIGSNTNRVLRVGSRMRVKITAVSLSRGASLGKIGVTCRQPFLGAIEWIEEDVKKAHEAQEAKK